MIRVLRSTLNITVKGWAAIVIVLGVALAVGFGVTLYGNQEHKLVEEVAARQDAGRADRLFNDYKQCLEINATRDTVRNVVSTAYTGTVTITRSQIAELPERTQALLADLEPLLKVSSQSTAATKIAVLATIPANELCVAPPGVKPVATTLPTTTTRPR